MDMLANEWDMDELIAAGFDEKELTGIMDGKPVDTDEKDGEAGALAKCPKCGFAFEVKP
jgi:hypothetical protein